MTRDETIWLAGLLEGEGCFDLNHGTPRIRVEMTDRDVVQRVANILGGNLRVVPARSDNWSESYAVQVSRTPATAKAMKALLPWLGKRRAAKVREILAE